MHKSCNHDKKNHLIEHLKYHQNSFTFCDIFSLLQNCQKVTTKNRTKEKMLNNTIAVSVYKFRIFYVHTLKSTTTKYTRKKNLMKFLLIRLSKLSFFHSLSLCCFASCSLLTFTRKELLSDVQSSHCLTSKECVLRSEQIEIIYGFVYSTHSFSHSTPSSFGALLRQWTNDLEWLENNSLDIKIQQTNSKNKARIRSFFFIFCMTNDSSISVKSPDCFNELLSTTTAQCLFFRHSVWRCRLSFLFDFVFGVLLKIHRYFFAIECIEQTRIK